MISDTYNEKIFRNNTFEHCFIENIQKPHITILGYLINFIFLTCPFFDNENKIESFHHFWTLEKNEEIILPYLKDINTRQLRNLMLASNKIDYYCVYGAALKKLKNNFPTEIPVKIINDPLNQYHLSLTNIFYKYPSPIFTLKKTNCSSSKFIVLDKNFKLFQKSLKKPSEINNQLVQYEIQLGSYFLVFDKSKLLISETIKLGSKDPQKENEQITFYFVMNNGLYHSKYKDLIIIVLNAIKFFFDKVYLENSGEILFLFDFEISRKLQTVENVVFLNPSLFLEKRFPFLSEYVHPFNSIDIENKMRLELLHYRSSFYFFLYKVIKYHISPFFYQKGIKQFFLI